MLGKLFDLYLIAAFLVALYAWYLIVVDGFDYSKKEGLLCLFVPFYADVYMFAKLEHPKKVAIIASVLVYQVSAAGAILHKATARYQRLATEAEAQQKVHEIVNGVMKYMSRYRSTADQPELFQPLPGHPGQYVPVSRDAMETPRELPPSAPPVPATLQQVSGKTYPSSRIDWGGTWHEIDFSETSPQRFQYEWERTSPQTGVARVTADLDGDGVQDVHFERTIQCFPLKLTPNRETLTCRASQVTAISGGGLTH